MFSVDDALAAFEQYYGQPLVDAAWRLSDGDLESVPRPVRVCGVEIHDLPELHGYEASLEWHMGAKEGFEAASHFFVVSYILCYGFFRTREQLQAELSEMLYRKTSRRRLTEWVRVHSDSVSAPPPDCLADLERGMILRDDWDDGIACADIGTSFAVFYWSTTG